MREPRLVELAAGIFLELRAERRHHVDGGMHRAEILPARAPCPSSPSERAAASTAGCTGPWRDRDTAAGACATAPSGGCDSCSSRSRIWRGRRARMTPHGHAHHRSPHLPRLSSPTPCWDWPYLPSSFSCRNWSASWTLVARHSAPLPRDRQTVSVAHSPACSHSRFPSGVLIGILIGLGGLSSDSELIAMNATGMGLTPPAGSRRRRGRLRPGRHAVA